MMSRFKLFLGILWALPITLPCFIFYVVPFWCLGWYEYVGFHDIAWAWKLKETAPHPIHSLWRGSAGHAMGNVIVLVERPNVSRFTGVILTHELAHVEQTMRLGIFQPIINLIVHMAIKIGCPRLNPHVANIFESDARKAAGQVADADDHR
jgi:hypothetical protein